MRRKIPIQFSYEDTPFHMFLLVEDKKGPILEYFSNVEPGDKIVYDESNFPFKNFDIKFTPKYKCFMDVKRLIGSEIWDL